LISFFITRSSVPFCLPLSRTHMQYFATKTFSDVTRRNQLEEQQHWEDNGAVMTMQDEKTCHCIINNGFLRLEYLLKDCWKDFSKNKFFMLLFYIFKSFQLKFVYKNSSLITQQITYLKNSIKLKKGFKFFYPLKFSRSARDTSIFYLQHFSCHQTFLFTFTAHFFLV
jgi:hypothetical protein